MPKETADVIFLDPPYHQGYEKKVLELLRDSQYINEDTLIVIETSLDTSFDYAETLGFFVEREKLYKTNKHTFLQRILL